MSNYTKATNFATKDTLPTGDSGKIVKGTEIDSEFNAIASAISSKADTSSPTFTGTPAAPTATAGSNTTQVATTAFVTGAVSDNNTAERTATATLTNKTLTSPTINTATINTSTITGGSITGITDLAVADGGTGVSSLTANSVLLGNGTAAIQTVSPSTSGNVLTSNGTTWSSTANPKIGVGQTWQNVTGSRTRGTTYTNSTGAPIMVCITAQAGGGPSPYQAEGYVDGSIVTQATCGFDTSALSFIVPNGSTYKYDGTAYTINLWTELR
jgi:hypothetical protein